LAIAIDPSLADAHYSLGAIYLIEGKLEEQLRNINSFAGEAMARLVAIAGWEPCSGSLVGPMRQCNNMRMLYATGPICRKLTTTWELRWRPEVTSPKPWSTSGKLRIETQ